MRLLPINPRMRKRLAICKMVKRARPIKIAANGVKWMPVALTIYGSIAAERWTMFPAEAKRLATVIWGLEGMTLHKNPNRCPYRVALNRSFAALRRAGVLTPVRDWLASGTAEQLFDSRGAYWARVRLHGAFGKIAAGSKAHQALDMGSGGRQPSWSICKAEDAALLAQYLHVIEGWPITAAQTEAESALGVNQRDIRRATSPGMVDEAMLRPLVESIRLKYRM